MTLSEQLGFSKDDRVLIPHIDDAGMCESVNLATADCLSNGISTCCSVMVPCPGFRQFAMLANDNDFDVGVHITLTSEPQQVRWKSLSGRTSLHDPDGFMWPTVRALERNAQVDDVAAEMVLQVETALCAGIDVTHLDAHMYAALHPRFVSAYLAVAEKFRLPPLFPRNWVSGFNLLRPTAMHTRRRLSLLGKKGFAFVDRLRMGTLPPRPDKVAFYAKVLSELRTGTTYMVTHPALDTDETKSLTYAEGRIQDHRSLTSSALRDRLAKERVHLVGMRRCRDLLRSNYDTRAASWVSPLRPESRGNRGFEQ